MYDNKVRLSQDVLEKAERIAEEWGLKNARAAVEAVFRRYSDEYLSGRGRDPISYSSAPATSHDIQGRSPASSLSANCEALDALEDLLGA